MSRPPRLLVDSGVIILLTAPDSDEEDEGRRKRCGHTVANMARLAAKYRLVVPAPVLAEIDSAVPADEHVSAIFEGLGGVTVLPFDQPAALEASKLHRQIIAENKASEPKSDRRCIKVDAMIAGIALATRTPIATTNKRDFQRLMKIAMKPVELFVVDQEPDDVAQLTLGV